MTVTRVNADSAYAEVQTSIKEIVKKFRRNYGGDIEELESEANWHFIVAFWTYDNKRGELTNWIRFKVKKGLLETKRTAAQRAAKLNRVEVDFDSLQTWDKKESADAERVKTLVACKDPTVFQIAKQCGEINRHTYRFAITTVLKSNGWTIARVKEAFEEVTESLQ